MRFHGPKDTRDLDSLDLNDVTCCFPLSQRKVPRPELTARQLEMDHLSTTASRSHILFTCVSDTFS